MTQKVNPSEFRPAEAFKTAGAIALAGGSSDGWISSSSSPSDLSVQDTGVTESNLNAFSASTSSSSLDVTIDGGEAFIYGSWVVKDSTSTVTLDASTSDQTVYVGWDKNGTNQVIVGLESAFETATDNTDEKIPIYSFNTDSTGVTSADDLRSIGKTITQSRSLKSGDVIQVIENDGLTVSGPYRNDGELIVNGSFTSSGPIFGNGDISGSGYVAVDGPISESVEPIGGTVDGTKYVMISGWTTDNDGNSYDAYKFERNSAIEIEKEEALTFTQQ